MQPFVFSRLLPTYDWCSPEARIIESVLRADEKKYGEVEVYVVGGAVRDQLFLHFHGGFVKPPKDVDLTTNLTEEEILAKLRTSFAAKRGIRVHEKESVDTFGVVFVNCNGKDFELAPFRKDVGSVDGRHPERVERGTIYEDAMRRDFTINNLYYDFSGRVLDFNVGPNGEPGQGITDVRNRVVRFVGDPFERIKEDKLRVMRFVRFFSRFNPGRIREHTDERTLAAIAHYIDNGLRKYVELGKYAGVSGERIATEFLLGIEQSLNTIGYVENCIDLGLCEAIFPGAPMGSEMLRRQPNLKNPRVVFVAIMYYDIAGVAEYLKELKYSSDFAEDVEFLTSLLTFSDHNAVEMIQSRDRGLIKTGKKKVELTPEEFEANKQVLLRHKQDLLDLLSVMSEHQEKQKQRIRHLMDYDLMWVSGESLMAQGHTGVMIGKAQRSIAQVAYSLSFESYQHANPCDSGGNESSH
jgi:tRNA nucleotidyltransferase/poly(A) polymerase